MAESSRSCLASVLVNNGTLYRKRIIPENTDR
jgi:hypothetical protein